MTTDHNLTLRTLSDHDFDIEFDASTMHSRNQLVTEVPAGHTLSPEYGDSSDGHCTNDMVHYSEDRLLKDFIETCHHCLTVHVPHDNGETEEHLFKAEDNVDGAPTIHCRYVNPLCSINDNTDVISNSQIR